MLTHQRRRLPIETALPELPIGPARRHNTVALTLAWFSGRFRAFSPSGFLLVQRLEGLLDPAAHRLTATAVARAGDDLGLDLDA